MSEETSIPYGLDAARRLQAAIRISMNTGSFYDTKFFVFSRRRSGSGLIDTPRPVYANSALLKAASPYCQTLLSSGFQETRVVNINTTYPPEWPSHLEAYDYEDDSDFEDEESLTEPEDSEVSSFGTTSESFPDATSEPTEVNVDHVIEPTPRLGRTVLISNAAYATWNALVYYIFTGEVVFKTLRSVRLEDSTTPPVEVQVYSAPPCSLKSMYRLADIIGADELKAKAMANIRLQKSAQNCLVELFCPFTSRYTNIHAIWLQYACDLKGGHGDHLTECIQGLTSGMLPHQSSTLEALLQKLLHYNVNPAATSTSEDSSKDEAEAIFESVPNSSVSAFRSSNGWVL